MGEHGFHGFGIASSLAMKPVVVTLSIPADAFNSQISLAEKISELPDPSVPELEALYFYAGRWESEISGRAQLKRIEVDEWVLNGSFLRQCWSAEGPEEANRASGITLMTFDAAKKAYLSWSFLAIRSVVYKEGLWDAASRTMTWTDKLARPGEVVVTKDAFVDEATNVWSIVEKDAKGKALREVNGRSVRRSA